ncbi:MAG: DUF2007 domain-containing protein [Saprospiraceae bacterium]|nr:DUF2007 domain-containing protein [Saprospiraceae bacterium]
METTVIKTFTDSFEANLILARLNENGIAAMLQNDEEVLIDPGTLSNQKIKLVVMNYDVEKALMLLEEVEME